MKLNKNFPYFFFLGDKNKSHQHFTAKVKEGGEGSCFKNWFRIVFYLEKNTLPKENIIHFTSPAGSSGIGATYRSERGILPSALYFCFCSFPLFFGSGWGSALAYKVQLQNLPLCLLGSKASPIRFQDGDGATQDHHCHHPD